MAEMYSQRMKFYVTKTFKFEGTFPVARYRIYYELCFSYAKIFLVLPSRVCLFTLNIEFTDQKIRTNEISVFRKVWKRSAKNKYKEMKQEKIGEWYHKKLKERTKQRWSTKQGWKLNREVLGMCSDAAAFFHSVLSHVHDINSCV